MTIKINGDNTVANPGFSGDDTDTGLQVGTNELKLVTGGSEAVTVDSSQNIGVGTTSPQTKLEVDNGSPSGTLPTLGGLLVTNAGTSSTTAAMCVATGSGPDFNVMNNGFVGVGTTSPSSKLTVSGTSATARLELQRTNAAGQGSYGAINFTALDGHSVAAINANGDGGADDNGGELVFRTTSDATSNDPYAITERMRISSNGNFFVGTTDSNLYNNNSSSGEGFTYIRGADLGVARWQGTVAYYNRMGSDGTIISLRQAGNQEGTISVSGSTVSYNGAHLSRWSQLAGGAARTEILRGSVLSNLDEMCEWGEENNEQLNRMKVSDVEGDVNVSGVFQCWDDDDDTYTNDFYCAMTGDFVIRIAQGTTVARGDLLMSAGDGTAKPQGDDIVRSKTIAKVTSTVVSETYADGSYCVPCVLMAC